MSSTISMGKRAEDAPQVVAIGLAAYALGRALAAARLRVRWRLRPAGRPRP